MLRLDCWIGMIWHRLSFRTLYAIAEDLELRFFVEGEGWGCPRLRRSIFANDGHPYKVCIGHWQSERMVKIALQRLEESRVINKPGTAGGSYLIFKCGSAATLAGSKRVSWLMPRQNNVAVSPYETYDFISGLESSTLFATGSAWFTLPTTATTCHSLSYVFLSYHHLIFTCWAMQQIIASVAICLGVPSGLR